MELGHAWNFLQIVLADIVLSGDNALIIGMAAAGLAPELRKRAIIFGMAAAAVLRIIFAIFATYLLEIQGLLFLGGLLLVWVCWRLLGEIRDQIAERAAEAQEEAEPDQPALALLDIVEEAGAVDELGDQHPEQQAEGGGRESAQRKTLQHLIHRNQQPAEAKA